MLRKTLINYLCLSFILLLFLGSAWRQQVKEEYNHEAVLSKTEAPKLNKAHTALGYKNIGIKACCVKAPSKTQILLEASRIQQAK